MRLLTALLLTFTFALSTHAQLVPKDAVPEKVADGYKFTEGPALGPDGCIYFTDIPAELILKFDPESGETTTFRDESGQANGLMWYEGDLYACTHRHRAMGVYLIRTKNPEPKDEDGLFKEEHKPLDPKRYVPLVEHWQGPASERVEDTERQLKEFRLNSPNDLTIDKNGNIYFTDPRYGSRDNMELKTEGVYCFLPTANIKPEEITFDHFPFPLLQRIDADLVRPNGIVLSPDEKILYVADNGANFIYAYDIEEPGKVKNKRIFGRINDGQGGGSDGMCVDKQGRLYATGHGKVWVFEPTGQLVNTIDVGKQTTNCTFGADGKTLYITANKGLYRIKLNTDALLERAGDQGQ